MKYPEMRRDLIAFANSLSDVPYQKKHWTDARMQAEENRDNFSMAVSFFFDDTALSTSPESAVGVFLKNELEAKSVLCLCCTIDLVLAAHGCHLADEAYMNTPEWSLVVEAAAQLTRILASSTE